jgi:hypothetical protein
MKSHLRAARLAFVYGIALAGGLSSCIGLQSPSGQGPQWAARMKANSDARKSQQAQAQAGGPGAAPGQVALGPDGVPLPGQPALPPGAAGAGATQDSGGSGFFGVLNNGDAPDIPQRPKYDQGARRQPITESSTTLLRQEVAPMDPVHFDKKTGYPIRQMETGYETLPLPREGAQVGAQMPASAITPTPAAPVAMDPKDIRTVTRSSTFGRVRSPYPPYLELDSSGVLPGSLARDPATGKVFRIP